MTATQFVWPRRCVGTDAGPVLCFYWDVLQWRWRPGPALHYTVQLQADREPG